MLKVKIHQLHITSLAPRRHLFLMLHGGVGAMSFTKISNKVNKRAILRTTLSIWTADKQHAPVFGPTSNAFHGDMLQFGKIYRYLCSMNLYCLILFGNFRPGYCIGKKWIQRVSCSRKFYKHSDLTNMLKAKVSLYILCHQYKH